MNNRELRKNSEGYFDPTTYEAIKNLDREENRYRKLRKAIFSICELAGFKIEGRIVLIDKSSGKVWR